MQIFDLADSTPKGHIQVQWMPSHLNDKDKAEQKRRALLSGIIDEEDILGNDGADKLANDGALMHTSNAYMAKRAQHRKDLTTVVQKMQAEIWNAFISNADPDTVAADEEAFRACRLAFIAGVHPWIGCGPNYKSGFHIRGRGWR